MSHNSYIILSICHLLCVYTWHTGSWHTLYHHHCHKDIATNISYTLHLHPVCVYTIYVHTYVHVCTDWTIVLHAHQHYTEISTTEHDHTNRLRFSKFHRPVISFIVSFLCDFNPSILWKYLVYVCIAIIQIFKDIIGERSEPPLSSECGIFPYIPL